MLHATPLRAQPQLRHLSIPESSVCTKDKRQLYNAHAKDEETVIHGRATLLITFKKELLAPARACPHAKSDIARKETETRHRCFVSSWYWRGLRYSDFFYLFFFFDFALTFKAQCMNLP